MMIFFISSHCKKFTLTLYTEYLWSLVQLIIHKTLMDTTAGMNTLISKEEKITKKEEKDHVI